LLLLTLLLVVGGSVAVGIADVIREVDTLLMLIVAAAGVLIGWALAETSFSGWLAGILASGYGFALVLTLVGHLGEEFLALFRPLADLAWGVFRVVWYWSDLPELLSGPLPDLWPVVSALTALGTDISVLMGRVYVWALALIAGEPTLDPVAVAFVWALAMWAVAVWMIWMAYRRDRALLGVAPACALLVITRSYRGGDPYVLLLPLSAVLLLLAAVGYDIRLRRLEAARVDLAYGLSVGTAMPALFLSLALVGAAAVAPSISIQDIIDSVRELVDRRAGTVEGGVYDPSSEGTVGSRPWTSYDQMRRGGLPRRHLIGSGSELSKIVVMVIRTGDLPPMPRDIMEMERITPPRYYWRSVTYDRYSRSGWITGDTETVEYPGGEPAHTVEPLPTQRTVRQEVRFVSDLGGLLHAAGTLVAADHDYAVDWRSPGDAFGATVAMITYTADSLVSIATEEQLWSAATDYPQWIRDRYLALPDTVTDRTLALARDLTATEPTPYDRARAIETYLRTFSYTLDVPHPPAGRDVVDYFLFDLQEGYCDYYATAMVVLARAAGLPARLVIGYASGSYDPLEAHYIVTEADAHAWPEIYFPGYEWIEFEPTAALPTIDRSEEAAELEWPEPLGDLEPAAGAEEETGEWWREIGRFLRFVARPALVALVLLGLFWPAIDIWRLRRLKPPEAVAVLYGRMRHRGQRLAAPVRRGFTPYEFAASLAGQIADLAQGRRWGKLLSPAIQEVCRLADAYVQASYSPYLPDVADRNRLIKTWRRLRWRLWLARLRQRIQDRREKR
jgi:transglutaminase-like putative cysteine protease